MSRRARTGEPGGVPWDEAADGRKNFPDARVHPVRRGGGADIRWPTKIAKECRATKRCLQAYLDDECDPVQGWSVARHLGHCQDCFVDAETLRRVKDAIGSLRVAPDPAVVGRLHGLVVGVDPSSQVRAARKRDGERGPGTDPR